MPKKQREKRQKKPMTRRRAITKLVMICLMIGVGLFLTFASFQVPVINNGNTRYVGFIGAIESRMGIDLQGGVLAVFDARPNEEMQGGNFRDHIEATRTRLEDQLHDRGFPEATVQLQGVTGSSGQIRVEVPGMQESQELVQVIGSPAVIDFRRAGGNESDIFLTGRHIRSVSVYNIAFNDWGVRLHFTEEGGRIFQREVRNAGVGGTIRIFSNDEQISAPTIQSLDAGADGTAVISGAFPNERSARELMTRIQSGLFEVRLETVEISNIPPTLGQGALLAGIIAFIVGIAFMFILMYLLYKDFGLLSNLSMIVFSILFLGLLAIIPMVQLTLPGIAGIILAMAMAVDANIIIFERIKDEYKTGKRMAVAVESGFNKSIVTIFDANITSIIAGAVLFFLGTGAIRGFAIVFMLGIVVSMFCSLFVLRQLAKLYLYINPTNPKRLRLYQVQGLDGSTVLASKPVKKERKLNV